MADRKYLAVYGKGATEVVGRVIEVWRNEEPHGNGQVSTKHPARGSGRWSRHLALQDMTGGLNYIGPYPELGLSTLYYRDVMTAVPEEKAVAMLKEASEGRLHVLKHVTGEIPSLNRLDRIEMTPNIEKQLEYGENKTHTVTRSAKGQLWSDVRWTWNEEVLERDQKKAFTSGIRAVTPADDPIIPIIVTGAKKEKDAIRVEGINPLDWKKESFRLTKVANLKSELDILCGTPGSIRMFRPHKYYIGTLNEAEIIHSKIKDRDSEKVSQEQLKSKYKAVRERLHEYNQRKTDKSCMRLLLAGMVFLTSEGVMETLNLAKNILRLEKDDRAVEKLSAIINETAQIISLKNGRFTDHQRLADVLQRMEMVMSNPLLWDVQFGNVNLSKLKPTEPEEEVYNRCRALLKTMKEYGGDLCRIDRDKQAVVWEMTDGTFEKPSPIRPKDNGIDVLPFIAEKHLNMLSDRTLKHMYMATRDSVLVLSANHEEGAAATSERLAGKIGNDREYMAPNERGHVKVPLYRSGYTRRLLGCDVRIQVSPTIADTWVLPTTARKYYVRLMKELSANKPDSDDGTGNIGVDVAKKVKEILTSDGKDDISQEERLSKLGQIALEIAGDAKDNDKNRQGKERV